MKQQNEGVKLTYSPITELVIHDFIEVDREDLLRERVTPSGTVPLYWCEGILFSFTSLPLTEDVLRDYLKGRLHWLEVHFSRVSNFTPIMALNEEEYKANLSVRIIDTSQSELHKQVARWLVANSKKR
jgi:hypothetical protein